MLYWRLKYGAVSRGLGKGTTAVYLRNVLVVPFPTSRSTRLLVKERLRNPFWKSQVAPFIGIKIRDQRIQQHNTAARANQVGVWREGEGQSSAE